MGLTGRHEFKAVYVKTRSLTQLLVHEGMVKASCLNDCVTVSVPHYAAFNAPVDDLCTWRRSG